MGKSKPSRWEQKWNAHFKLLQKFVEREGHALVPKRHVEDGFELGIWLQQLRSSRNSFPKERIKALESLPGWVWRPYEERWNRAYKKLVQFVEREGHARVPRNHVEDDFALGTWVSNTRSIKDSMPKNRKKALERLPGWSWNPKKESWVKGFGLLKDYFAREGHSRVAYDHLEDGFALGQWVAHVRSHHSDLSEDRIKDLESIKDWVWDTLEHDWQYAYKRLLKWVKREKHARVPITHVEEDGFRLGVWVRSQRTGAWRGNISEERCEALEALPGWMWNVKNDRWFDVYELLLGFVEREGHSRVPRPHVEEGFRLGPWVLSQRIRKAELSLDKKDALESLPGWVWNVDEYHWQVNYECLVVFINKYGHSRVPSDFDEDGVKLGSWVKSQRTQYKAGKIFEYKKEALEKLEGWTWYPEKERAWFRGYNRLLDFIRREGHLGVPKNHIEKKFDLGAWVDEQHRAYKNGTLTKEQIRKLNEVPLWRWPSKQKRRSKKSR